MRGNRDWTILFIGGPTVAGKSSLASKLRHHFGVGVIEVDLFNKVLERALPPSHNRGFQLFGQENVWQLPTPELVERLIRYSEFVCDALEVVVANRLSKRQPAIIEGVWLLPSFARKETYTAGESMAPQIPVAGACRSVFLVEPELEEMERRLEERYYAGWLASNPGNSATSHLYGLEVARTAKELGIPVLECRPFETLLERAIAVLS